ncbi:MAG: BlaI/MecI/CopY family transcriptional regulator [Lachnospiraceae bacterium]|nr:BlaI/MecI/CopY family transcriptional regulator [Lachnospiraceae bacterium]MDD3795895.1 BlaI/MecI/CopY family transcriptional regulator [Lachnospiraceae bacterium]
MKTKISGAELEIMEYLWDSRQPCTFAALLDYFNSVKKKDWCKQTLNTCVLRLKKKGLLVQEKNGVKSIYVPAITREQYHQICAEEILKESYGGLLVNFLAALSGNDAITELDQQKLLEYIKNER